MDGAAGDLRLKFPLRSRIEPLIGLLALSDDERGFREQVLTRAADAEWQEMLGNLAMATLSIGLGLAAGVATGGLGLALTAAAVGVGVLDATWQTGEYFEDLALSNTAENRQDSFVSPEQMEGAEFWLAVAWVGAGIDLASGIKVLALLRGGARLADALQAVGHAGKEAALLAETAGKNLVDELRRLVPDLGLDPAFATAGGPVGVPYDRVVRETQVPGEQGRALRPDGWAARVEDGDELGELSWGGGGRASQAEPQSYLDNLAEEGIHPAGTVRAGMARRPRHHVFPDEHRAWFEDHGFVGEWDIDNFTVEMDGGFHAAIHGGGDWKTGRALSEAKGGGKDLTPEMQAELDAWAGEWNTTVMDQLKRAQSRKGRALSRDEVIDLVEDLMDDFTIPRHYVPYRE